MSIKKSGTVLIRRTAPLVIMMTMLAAMFPFASSAASKQTVRLTGTLSADGSVLSVTCEIANPAGTVDSGMIALKYDSSLLNSPSVSQDGTAKIAAAKTSGGIVSVEWYYVSRLTARSSYTPFAVIEFKVKNSALVQSLDKLISVCGDADYLKKLGGYQNDGGVLVCGGSSSWSYSQGTAVLNVYPTISVGNAPAENVVRMGGATRYETAVLISRQGWKTSGYAVIASGSSFADALAGVPLAAELEAPILLVTGKTVSAEVSAELSRLKVSRIVILGGASAVSDSIETSLSKSYSVERISGADRFATAVAIAKRLQKLTGRAPKEICFAYAYNYPDAMAVSPAAGINGMPILYAPAEGSIDSVTADYVRSTGCTSAVVVGGTSVVGATVEKSIRNCGVSKVYRLSGEDRYETALKICRYFDSVFRSDDVAVSTGKNFPDALAGAAFAASKSIPVVLVGDLPLTSGLAEYVRTRDPETMYVFGGTTVVPDHMLSALSA